MHAFWQDLRHGARMLFHRPSFTFIAVLTLSLGIGATTAIFSVVDAVLLRALPYPAPERLVQLREINEQGARIRFTEPNYLDVQARNHTLEAIAQYAGGPVVVTGGSAPVRARTFWVSRDFFKVMDVQPHLGRGFLPEESKPGGAPVALVSYGFWLQLLSGRPDFSGAKLNVDGVSFSVVGVMPPDFNHPGEAEIWVPREVEPAQTSRTAHNWMVVARLRPDATLAQARADLSAIGKQLRQEHGTQTDAVDFAVVPLQEILTDNVRFGLWTMLAAVGLLLLIACANVANLLLARVTARAHELAVRAALGATRWRIARQFITENLLLALLAGTVGVLLAVWGVDLLRLLNPGNLPRAAEIAVNGRVLLFTLGLATFIALALGLVPLARFVPADLQTALKDAGRNPASQSGGQRLRSLLVVTQIALTLVLLTGAGLLGRSFLNLLQTEPGFTPESAVAVTVSLPTTVDRAQEQRLQQFHEQLLTRLKRLPGVVAVGGINALPLTGRGANGQFLKDNNAATPGQAEYRLASGGYFAAMGIPLLRGRTFDERDSGNAPDAAVISQTLAHRYWPNEDPLGRTLQFGNMDGDKQLLHIIGIVGNVRDRGLDQQPTGTVYAHSLQRPQWWQVSNQSYVVRAQADPATLMPALRAEVQSLNPEALVNVSTLEQVFSSSLDQRRFSLVIFGIFAVVALLLAAAGIYGVMSYAVSQRTQEIGVRIALGAQSHDVVLLVIKQGLTLALAGVLLGLGGAWALLRVIKDMLFGVSTADPLTFLGIAFVLTLVALLACWLPARRAAKVDPLVALRYE
jgi:putative ABC transport system permease protein